MLQEINDRAPFRQGDILAPTTDVLSKPDQENHQFLVILTADCDIAQSKMGQFFSVVPIVGIEEYVRKIWAREELEKMLFRASNEITKDLNTIIEKHRPELRPFDREQILTLIARSGPTPILSIPEIAKANNFKKLENLSDQIVSISKALDGDGDTLMPLNQIKLKENNNFKIIDRIKDAIKPSALRAEFMLIPTLPSTKSVGFIIKLREIQPLHIERTFKSELEAKVAGRPVGSFFRVGRFSDLLRFSVAQRFATLFARIGLTEHFELEADTAAELARLMHRDQSVWLADVA